MACAAARGTRGVSAHTISPQVKGELTGSHGHGGLPVPNGGMERKPVRIRRGPATVTGERTQKATARWGWKAGPARIRGARRLSPPVESSQGADPE
ncbi:hypothetical protein GCM10009863_53180 [Streptomyces axinellae]|uniref:Transposase n=1 Tax=Streptomyces axinellae TaxID=552788 RepID=A0ABN3QNT2_9ACTN